MTARNEVLAMAKEADKESEFTKHMQIWDSATFDFVGRIISIAFADGRAAEREECAKDKVDAERYRFLRKQHEFDDDQASNNNYGKNYPPRTMCVFQDDGADGLEPVKCDPGALDEAIDRARSVK